MSSRKEDEQDFYSLLGVAKTASMDEIRSAYKRRAMQYHPDKNPGNEDAAERFKQMSTALTTLTDPASRRQYDLGGSGSSSREIGIVSVEDMGYFTRSLGSLASRFGVSVKTEIARKVLVDAKQLAKNHQGLPEVKQLQMGEELKNEVVQRQCANFYEINVTSEDLTKGVIIKCHSPNGDRFKLVFFDKEGDMAFVEECQHKEKITEANIYLLPFNNYKLGEALETSPKKKDGEIPPVVKRLDTYEVEDRKLHEGKNLFCIYGDNWFNSSTCSLKCLVVNSDEAGSAGETVQVKDAIDEIKDLEKELVDVKNKLDVSLRKYINLKYELENADRIMKEDSKKAEDLIRKRDEAYAKFVENFVRRETPEHTGSDENTLSSR